MESKSPEELRKEKDALEQKLRRSDAVFIQKIEYEMVGKSLSVDFVALHKKRERWRERLEQISRFLRGDE